MHAPVLGAWYTHSLYGKGRQILRYFYAQYGMAMHIILRRHIHIKHISSLTNTARGVFREPYIAYHRLVAGK